MLPKKPSGALDHRSARLAFRRISGLPLASERFGLAEREANGPVGSGVESWPGKEHHRKSFRNGRYVKLGWKPDHSERSKGQVQA